MYVVSNDLDGIGVEAVVGNGFGGCVENRRNVVFSLNMGWNGW